MPGPRADNTGLSGRICDSAHQYMPLVGHDVGIEHWRHDVGIELWRHEEEVEEAYSSRLTEARRPGFLINKEVRPGALSPRARKTQQ